MDIGIIVIAIVVIVAAWAVVIYNQLIGLRVRVREAMSGIDVQLKRRTNLIPNLVATVKGYVKQEKEVLTQVTNARSALMKAKSPQDKAVADNMLTGALKSLFAVSENYPELKSNENFMQLQKELSDTEDKIAASRQFYNSVVQDFNTKQQVFPNALIARQMGFQPEEFYEVEAQTERKNVTVKF